MPGRGRTRALYPKSWRAVLHLYLNQMPPPVFVQLARLLLHMAGWPATLAKNATGQVSLRRRAARLRAHNEPVFGSAAENIYNTHARHDGRRPGDG